MFRSLPFTLSAALLTLFAAFSGDAEKAASAETAHPYSEILNYDYGKPRTALFEIEERIRSSSPEELAGIEARLLATIRAPEATTACKDWACRQLRQAGSERSVATLVSLLADEKLHTAARWALEAIPGASVDRAIRDALPNLRGDLKAGAVLTIAARRDREAVPLLAPLASDPDACIAEAALYALGRIGGEEALRAVRAAKVPPGLEAARDHAALLCAESLFERGERERAAAAYKELYEKASEPPMRAAALRGLLVAKDPGGAQAALGLLRGEDPSLRGAAAKFLCEIGPPEALNSVLSDLGSLPAQARIQLLDLVCEKSAVPALMQAAREGEVEVRAASVRALGRVGDASSAGFLLETAAKAPDAVRAAAREGLRRLGGSGVDEALAASVRSGEIGVRMEAIRALAARGSRGASAALLEATRDPERSIRLEALSALAELADPASLPALFGALCEAKSPEERSAAEKALAASCARARDRDAAAAAVISAMAGRSAEVRASLLRALAAAPSAKAFEAVRGSLEDPEPPVREEAVRALANWGDPSALDGLLAIARGARQEEAKSAALKALVRLASAPIVGAEKGAAVLSEAAKLPLGVEEKKALLSSLSKIAHPRALEAALGMLREAALEVEAATAALAIAKALRATNPDAAESARAKILEVARSPLARELAEASQFVPAGMINIASQGVATSPDGIEPDGASGGDRAAIDGDPNTYWDEEDGKPLYRLVVELPQARRIGAISILGHQHHQYAPKDFEILCDGVVVKKVEGAQYDSNFLVVRFGPVSAKTIELRITGYYGQSPAIRELGIYRPEGR